MIIHFRPEGRDASLAPLLIKRKQVPIHLASLGNATRYQFPVVPACAPALLCRRMRKTRHTLAPHPERARRVARAHADRTPSHTTQAHGTPLHTLAAVSVCPALISRRCCHSLTSCYTHLQVRRHSSSCPGSHTRGRRACALKQGVLRMRSGSAPPLHFEPLLPLTPLIYAMPVHIMAHAALAGCLRSTLQRGADLKRSN